MKQPGNVNLKRVAGVEPKSLPGHAAPPAHELEMDGASVVPGPLAYAEDAHRGTGADLAGEVGRARTAESPGKTRLSGHPSQDPAEEFARHFFRCFFCRVGDNRIEDHFCEIGRELMVVMLDEIAEREWNR